MSKPRLLNPYRNTDYWDDDTLYGTNSSPAEESTQ